MPPKVKRLGRRYGRWTVLEEAGRNKKGSVLWLFRCDCGTEVIGGADNLQSGVSKSCGCWRKEALTERNRSNRKTHCLRGHRYTSQDIDSNGHHSCKVCRDRQRQTQEGRAAKRAARRRYYAEHRDHILEQRRRYRKANPDKARAYRRKRRALKKSQLGLWEDDAFIERQLWLYQRGRCYYCQAPISEPFQSPRTFHLDHVIPLSRGGEHCVSNVVLACCACNLNKGTKTAEEFRCALQ